MSADGPDKVPRKRVLKRVVGTKPSGKEVLAMRTGAVDAEEVPVDAPMPPEAVSRKTASTAEDRAARAARHAQEAAELKKEFEDAPKGAPTRKLSEEEDLRRIGDKIGLAIDPERKPPVRELGFFERAKRRAHHWFFNEPLFGKKREKALAAVPQSSVEAARPMSDMARKLTDYLKSEKRETEIEKQAESIGVAKLMRKMSAGIDARMSKKQRLALSAALVSLGIAGTLAAGPAIATIGFGGSVMMRMFSAVSVSAGLGMMAESFLERRGATKARATLAGEAVTIGVFLTAIALGSGAASHWLDSLDTGRDAADAATASMNPGAATPATPVSFEPPPGFVAPDVPTAAAADLPSLSPEGDAEYISAADGSPFSPAHDTPDIATSQPDIVRGEIEVPSPEAMPIEISGDTSVWSALTDSLADRGIELSERGQQSLAHAVQKVLESTDVQGEFIEKGGTAVSGVPWDRLPDGAMIHFDKLFENEEFAARLEKVLSSSSYKTLGKEIAGMGGVSDFLGKVAHAYGAR